MFATGDFIFSEENEHVHVVQILQVSTDYLIKDYWESSTLNLSELEIRFWVKRVEMDFYENYRVLKNEELIARDLEEIGRFLEIEKGLNDRKERTVSMPHLVENAIQNGDYQQALDLLTEWAMLDKYRSEIYLLREDCLRKLGRNAEADYELQVYQTLTGK